MVDKLRALCTGYSADVYITTPDNSGTYKTYSAIMVWPQAQAQKRQVGGKYLGLEFVFRRLVLIPDPEE
jgi:hypothetical protein